MKAAIVGYGFVGKALANGFLSSVDLIKIDPKLQSSISDLKSFMPDLIFICVPTPMSDDGSQDISLVEEVLKEIETLDLGSLVVIKSTILPDNIEHLSHICNSFIYNPEFLREKHADKDFIKSPLIVFGGQKENCQSLGEFYNLYTKCISKNYFYTDQITASLVKYTINSFLATKVSFFNELFNLFKNSGTSEDWKNFVEIISMDKRIGSSHMQVPGHDGRFGFGGACLPKDSKAFLMYSEVKDSQLTVLKSAIDTNNNIRGKYNKKTDREEEQNIHFKEKN